VKWDTTGVAVYFFPHGSVPADISVGAPEPDSWGNALARWPAASCAPFKFFNDHHVIFDTTLWCVMLSGQSNALTPSYLRSGDWAGAVWDIAGIPGQEKSCAQRTGFSTCEAFVRASGSAMSEACG